MLGGSDLVVGSLNGDAKVLEGEDRLAPQVGAGVERGEVEVAADIEDLRRLGVGEVEEFELGADVEGVVEVGGALEVAAEDEAGVALERRAIRVRDVAERSAR